MNLKAANIFLLDICGLNKETTTKMLKNFFCAMEVYGH